MSIALCAVLLALSLAANVLLATRMHRYRKRYKQGLRLLGDVTDSAAAFPVVRLGECVPEVGDDRDPQTQAATLLVPYAGRSEYAGCTDKELATLARLTRTRASIALLGFTCPLPLRTVAANLAAHARCVNLSITPDALAAETGLFDLIVMGGPGGVDALSLASSWAMAHGTANAVLLWVGHRGQQSLNPALPLFLDAKRLEWRLARLHGTSFIARADRLMA